MNVTTPFDAFVSTLCTNLQAHKEYGYDYAFEYFYGILITNQHKLLEEGNLGVKHHAHLLKGKRKMGPRDRLWFDASTDKPTHYDQNYKGNTNALHGSRNNKTCHYCGNIGHVEKVFYKKQKYLEEKVKFLEGNMSTVH
jgi:hypothetical protein